MYLLFFSIVYEVCTNLLLLKRLLDLLQVGQQSDVCANLQQRRTDLDWSTTRGRHFLLQLTLWTVAPILARLDKQSTSTLRL